MFCQQCGKPNPEGVRFCENCGAPLQQASQPYAPANSPVQPVYQQPIYQQPAVQSLNIRNAGIAGFLSFLCCGLGQLYNGQTLKGIGFFASAVAVSAIISSYLGLVIVIGAIYDAYATAKKINTGQERFTGKSALFWPVVILIILLIIVAVLFLGLFAFLLSELGNPVYSHNF